MDVKVFEVLAPGTKSAALAVRLGAGGTVGSILRGRGFGDDTYFFVATLGPGPNYITYDKFHWLNGGGGIPRGEKSMMFLVHDEIAERWGELASGDALDLTPRWGELSERLERFMQEDD